MRLELEKKRNKKFPCSNQSDSNQYSKTKFSNSELTSSKISSPCSKSNLKKSMNNVISLIQTKEQSKCIQDFRVESEEEKISSEYVHTMDSKNEYPVCLFNPSSGRSHYPSSDK